MLRDGLGKVMGVLWLVGCGASEGTDDVDGVDTDPGLEAVDGSAAPVDAYDPLPLVDPFVATGGVGAEITNVNPGAAWPNGMVTVGPDTRTEGSMLPFYHTAGYHYDDDRIHGFSHIHPHSMGVAEGSALTLAPMTGWDPAYTDHLGRMQPLDHAAESASPGRYAVRIEENDLDVEVVATERGALWTVNSPEPVIVVDNGFHQLTNSVEDGWVELDLDAGELRVYQNLHGAYSGRFGGFNGHMLVTFDPAPVGGGVWSDPDAPQPLAQAQTQATANGATSGAWLTFAEGVTEVTVRSAVSFVDIDGARANHDAELTGTREEVLANVEGAWRDILGKVRVRGEDEDVRRFHTAQYHNHLMPSRLDDADGRYRGTDQLVHTADSPHYSDLSLWDTFRTTHPWYIWLEPQLQEDVNQSLLRMSQDGGALPRWPLAHGTTGGMVGAPAVQLLAESYLKGLRGWDVEDSFDAAYTALTEPGLQVSRGGVEAYMERGWIAYDEAGSIASRTLEYAWNDHAAAVWAEALGRKEATTLGMMAESWRNVWDPSQGYFTGRDADGAFTTINNPLIWNGPIFTEGNAYSYLWYVPYDVPAMVEVQHGGDVAAFHERLRAYWAEVDNEEDDLLSDSWYWHGNQPPWHHVALGSLSGAPDLSAEAARMILRTRYDMTPDEGLDGNDDGGSQSAWFLFNALGMYPIAGTVDYAVTSPIFERAEIDQPGGTLVLRAPGTSETALYVAGVTVDGTALDRPAFDHDTLAGAAEIVFEMREDAVQWGSL